MEAVLRQPFGDGILRCWELAGPAFEAAVAAAGGAVERSFTLAGRRVTLRFAGPALVEPLSAALEHHLPAQPGDGGLTISVWDAASTGVPLPPVPAVAADGGTSGPSRVASTPDLRAKYEPGARVLSLLDRRRAAAVYALADAALLPPWERGSPFRFILHWWAADRGAHLLHAGAVGTPAGGVLLAGKSGSGKSTAALACLGSELRYAADDYCLVRVDPEPTAHTLYASAKLEPAHAARFPQLAPALANADRLEREKALFLVHRAYPEHMLPSFPIRAVVVPRVAADGASRLEETSPAAALHALAPSTILQLPAASGDTLAALARLVRPLPCYRLHLGELADVPALLLAAAKGGRP